VRPSFEALEGRNLLSGPPTVLTPLEARPDDTLNAAADLGTLTPGSPVQSSGVIGDSPAGPADVDWYQFTVDQQPLQVTLQAVAPSGSGAAPVVVSLYNSDPGNVTDPYERYGHRLIAQDDASGDGAVRINRALAPGTYFVAVSGDGNRYFSPVMADSGYDGSTGPYTLLVSATDLGLDPSAGPVVLASDPADQAVLTHSPSFLRIDLSEALDTDTTPPDQIVHLTYSPDGNFDGTEPDLPLADVQYSANTDEILLVPVSPLAPGYYSLSLLPPDGVDLSGPWPTDGSPVPLQQPWSITFQVAGVEGNTGPSAVADDTPAGAHQLGDVTGAGLVQATGSIGDDPTAPVRVRPAADVDLYHFRVSGPGTYALTSEIFAGRIDSPLNPGLSLFRLDPTTNRLVLVAGNDDTGNDTLASDGRSVPLRGDAALFAGLTAGDYYLAVSSSGNVPDPIRGILPGQQTPRGRIFDPNVSHSGTAGSSTGDYVLNLLVQPATAPPRVLSVTPGQGATLSAPLSTIQVQFSEAVNVQQLAFEAFQRSAQGGFPAVFLVGPDGTHSSPRFASYDPMTNTATLLLLDPLPNGAYQLHLSGPLGLASMDGTPLVGNDQSGDYVVRFQQAAPPRGSGGNPLTWQYVDSAAGGTVHQQALGVLFPDELHAGVNVVRQPSAGAQRPQSADAYTFSVLQQQSYLFQLGGANLPPGITLSLFDAAGNLVPIPAVAGELAWQGLLAPGTYRVVLQGWTAAEATGVGYDLTITMLVGGDSPVPLTSGPAPAIRLRLLSPSVPADPTSDSGAPAGPPQLTLPSVQGAPGSAGSQSAVQVTSADDKATAPLAGTFPLGLVDKLSPATGAVPAVAQVSGPDGQPRGGNLPFSLLSALGTGPAGPVNTTGFVDVSGPAPRLILQLPNLPLPEALTRLLVTPLLVTGGDEESLPYFDVRETDVPNGTPARPVTLPPAADRPVEWPRDLWFSRLGLADRYLPGVRARESAGVRSPVFRRVEALLPPEGGAENEFPDAGPEASSAAPTAADRGWALGLALLMAGGLRGPGEERRRQAAHRRPAGKGRDE
jgi:hypothetical protein